MIQEKKVCDLVLFYSPHYFNNKQNKRKNPTSYWNKRKIYPNTLQDIVLITGMFKVAKKSKSERSDAYMSLRTISVTGWQKNILVLLKIELRSNILVE